MELLGLLTLALIFGLIFRKKGDSSLDIFSTGCGCVGVLVIIFIGLVLNAMIWYNDTYHPPV